MRLFAAIVPPPEVLDEIDAVVRAVGPVERRGRSWRTPAERPPSPAGQHAGRRRGLLRRMGGQSDSPAREPEPPETEQLTRLPVVRMHIPITTFGHLTRVDSELLADALRTAVATWERPTLHFTGGTALEFPGDQAVWARLGGDLDRLQVIGQGVPKVVQRLGIFVDRRQFRPWLSLGTITEETTAAYLEELVAALDRFAGTTWTHEHVSLMSGQPGGGPREPYEELERMPLAAP
ncbi:MAG: hypothetical protein ABI873_17185 [Marmoricola sp.]